MIIEIASVPHTYKKQKLDTHPYSVNRNKHQESIEELHGHNSGTGPGPGPGPTSANRPAPGNNRPAGTGNRGTRKG